MSIFPERLKAIVDQRCQERGTTVEKMAIDLEIGRSRFRHYWERGSRPSHDVLLQIADFLDVDLNWLFGRDATMEWPKDDKFDAIRKQLSLLEKQNKD